MNILYRMVCFAALVTVGSVPVAAQHRAAGTWHGGLATPAGRITLVFRIQEGAGGWTGELEAVDEIPSRTFPLAGLEVSTQRLAFSVPTIGARFEGTWRDGAGSWVGEYHQGLTIPLSLERGAPPAKPTVAGLDGTWRGVLRRNEANLRLILHVRTGRYGTLVKLDSPDLGASGLPVERFERAGDTVRFQVPSGAVRFDGQLSSDGGSLRGRWVRADQPEVEVAFERVGSETTARVRTQWPIEIRGYRAEEVVVPNPSAAGVALAGTLTIPDGPGPFPAAVLISGSGPQDRDETIYGHKPFAVLADHLSRHGIAVLRYDDRGVGASTGDHGRATSADFATDANAVLQYLRGRSEIDHGAVGFIGHSEGGLIGPVAAAGNEQVAFLVMLAGPGTNTVQLSLTQRRLLGLSQDASAELLERTEPAVRALYEAVRSTDNPEQATAKVRALLTPETLQALGESEAQRDAIVRRFTSPWMRYFIRYEPSEFLSRVRAPILAISGSLDWQVPTEENLAGLRTILAGHPDATVRELPGLNHMFQTARTGTLGEYADLAETFAPDAMALISDWILARFGPRARGP